MENPFELILEKLDRIEKAIEELKINRVEKPESKLMNLGEVSQYINLAPSSIYGLVHQKKIPNYKVGKKLYFEKFEIDNWIKKGKNKTRKEIEFDANEYLGKHSL